MIDGGEIILRRILGIIEELYLIFVNQIFEFFFQISHHNSDIGDSDRVKLLDLAFDHPLSENLKKSLGHFEGERHEAGAEACSHN